MLKYRKIAAALGATFTAAALVLAPSAAFANTVSAEASVDVGASGDCLARGEAAIGSYLAENGLANDAEVYVACKGDTATVWSPEVGGDPLAVAPPEEQAAKNGGVGTQAISGFSCNIYSSYGVECSWTLPYQKYSGSTLIWTRTLASYATLDLQVNSHKVYQRYTHNQGINFDIEGNIILQRQNGILPPSFENSEDFDFWSGGTQESGTEWVDRTNGSAGKYSVIFNPMYITDHNAGVTIPLVGDPTSPRFQCAAASTWNNCEYPGGNEAPIF